MSVNDTQRSQLIDVQAAAVRLGVSPRFVRRLVSEKRIGYFKIGKYVRFDPLEIEAWIESQRVESTPLDLL